MNRKTREAGIFTALIISSLMLASPAHAERGSYAASIMKNNANDVRFDIDEYRGFERRRFGSMRVRGWQIAGRVYFGQAKIADEWGLGFVIEDGDTVYGFNNRGIEVTRYF